MLSTYRIIFLCKYLIQEIEYFSIYKIHYHLYNNKINRRMIMIRAKIKKSFLVIPSPPLGGKHSTAKFP